MFEKIKQNKIVVVIILIGIVLTIALIARNYSNNISTNSSSTPNIIEEESMEVGTDPLNTTYDVEGELITLVDGKSEEAISNSSTKIITSVWGELATTDLDGNIVNNPALILLQEPGGSGSFYYIAVSAQKDLGYKGTNAIFLGDRIEIQTVEIDPEGLIVVNFKNRPEGDSMTEEPSVEVSKSFILDGEKLVEVSLLGN